MKAYSVLVFPYARLGIMALSPLLSSCLALADDCEGKIFRFIEGEDAKPVLMDAAQKAQELNDPFALSVLCANAPASSLKLVTEQVDQSHPSFDKKQYVVAEGGQIAASKDIPPSAKLRNMRYAVSWTNASGAAQILASSAPLSDSESNFLQVIAYDESKQKFNFYERFNAPRKDYFWAGDSSWARRKQTIGQGCFDCHHNGIPIMKELKIPWNNWDSERANIDISVVDKLTQNDPPFKNRVGAQELEPTIRGAQSTYYESFIRSHINDDFTKITNVPELLRFVIEDTTVNLESNNPPPNNPPRFAFSTNFWIADSVLRGSSIALDYNIPSSLMFSKEHYNDFLAQTNSRLEQCRLNEANKTQCQDTPKFTVAGSTHFVAFTPVKAAEDVLMANLLTRATVGNRLLKLVAPKFIAAILMVDFQNPVFSPKRSSLIQYAQAVAVANIVNSRSDMGERVAKKITDAAAKQTKCNDASLDTCSAEQQFAAVWQDNDWQNNATLRINKYFTAISDNMKCTAQGNCIGQDQYLKLLASRHVQMARAPIIGNLVEFSLLFPFSNLPTSPFLRMTAHGEVVEVK